MSYLIPGMSSTLKLLPDLEHCIPSDQLWQMHFTRDAGMPMTELLKMCEENETAQRNFFFVAHALLHSNTQLLLPSDSKLLEDVSDNVPMKKVGPFLKVFLKDSQLPALGTK